VTLTPQPAAAILKACRLTIECARERFVKNGALRARFQVLLTDVCTFAEFLKVVFLERDNKFLGSFDLTIV
jgi:hypothetical protein